MPDTIEGTTLLPLLRGETAEFRESVASNNEPGVPQRMFVKGDYALVHTLSNPLWDHLREYELFNLAKDPEQLHDVSSEEPDKAAELRVALSDWLARQLQGMPDPLQASVLRLPQRFKGLSVAWTPEEYQTLLERHPQIRF